MPEQHYSQEDRFVAGVLQIWSWAQKNTRVLFVGLAAIAIIVFGVRYYLDYQKRVRQTASTEIRAIRYELAAGNPDQVVDRLRSFLVQFDGTDYAREARLLLAHSLLLVNQAPLAIEPARRAADKLGTEPLSTRAALLLAAAYEEVADTANAISTYEDVGRRAPYRVDKSRGLEGAARIRAAQGDLAGAAAIYRELAQMTPETAPMRRFYEMRAAENSTRPLVTSYDASAEGS